MATQHNLYTVGTTAIPISESNIGSGRDFTIQNANDTGYIYIGGNGVTSTSYGYRILPNHAISFELDRQDELFAVASQAGMSLAVLSINLEGKE